MIKLPKPIAKRRELIGELHPFTGSEEWFTDGHVAVKGSPPKKKLVGYNTPFNRLEQLLQVKSLPATLLFFGVEGRFDYIAVSKTFLPKLGEEEPLVIFSTANDFISYQQARFNVIRKRYPECVYRITEAKILVAYADGEAVGLLAPTTKIIQTLIDFAFAKGLIKKKNAKKNLLSLQALANNSEGGLEAY